MSSTESETNGHHRVPKIGVQKFRGVLGFLLELEASGPYGMNRAEGEDNLLPGCTMIGEEKGSEVPVGGVSNVVPRNFIEDFPDHRTGLDQVLPRVFRKS